jgi:hypothetical protein
MMWFMRPRLAAGLIGLIFCATTVEWSRYRSDAPQVARDAAAEISGALTH